MDENEFVFEGVTMASKAGNNSCEGCFFEEGYDCEEMKRHEIMPFCTELCRDDRMDVIFVEKQQ